MRAQGIIPSGLQEWRGAAECAGARPCCSSRVARSCCGDAGTRSPVASTSSPADRARQGRCFLVPHGDYYHRHVTSCSVGVAELINQSCRRPLVPNDALVIIKRRKQQRGPGPVMRAARAPSTRPTGGSCTPPATRANLLWRRSPPPSPAPRRCAPSDRISRSSRRSSSGDSSQPRRGARRAGRQSRRRCARGSGSIQRTSASGRSASSRGSTPAPAWRTCATCPPP